MSKAVIAAREADAATITELRQCVAELEERLHDAQDYRLCGCSYDYPDDICLGHKKLFDRLAEKAVLAEREACAKVCEEQIKIFLSPKYAAGQPMSSFGERFACGKCAQAIRNRSNDHEG